MAVPKRRTSRMKIKSRRSANSKCNEIFVVTCSECGSFVLPHRICPECGKYDKKKIIDVDKK